MPRKATHKVSFYGVRCFTDDHTGELWGCNWFWELLVVPAVLWDSLLRFVIHDYCTDGFPLRVIEDYTNDGSEAGHGTVR